MRASWPFLSFCCWPWPSLCDCFSVFPQIGWVRGYPACPRSTIPDSYACTCLSQRDLSHLNLPEAFSIRKTSTKHLFHQKGFTPKSKALLHHEPFTPATLSTRSLLHQTPFTYCIKNYLYTSETFYTKAFYITCPLHRSLLHQENYNINTPCLQTVFAPATFYAKGF